MAAIDFPASPTVGQIFGASNGVNYQWNGTLWLAAGGFNAPSPGGDFSATHNVPITLPTSFQTLALNTIRSGNSGNWYSAGRYTPPAGRYFLATSVSATIGGAVILLVQITKNGTPIAYGVSSNPPSWASVTVEATADASGTDWFELQAYCTTAGVQTHPDMVLFTAFPISGIKGPPGDPGAVPGATSATTFLGATVACATANTYINGPSTGSIGASGQKWLIMASATYVNNGGGAFQATARIWDGATGLANASQRCESGGSFGNMTLSYVATLAGATTFTLQGADNVGGNAGGLFGNGVSTHITAVRLS